MKTIRNHFWSLMLSFFFLVLLTLGIGYLILAGGFNKSVSIGDFILMTLAIFRLIRLFTYDTITKFMRDWFIGAPPSSLRGTLFTLLTCPWCVGLWFSFVVVFFYFYTPYAWPVMLILALSALGSFLQLLANFVGWSAEAKKREVVGAEHSHTTCG